MNDRTFIAHWQAFVEQSRRDGRFILSGHQWQKQLADDTQTTTGYSYCYVAHTGWAARKLMRYRPKRHVDFGSYVYFVSIASAIVESFEFYDIRPAHMPLPGLTCGAADLKSIAMPNDSVESLSCLHVMEHVGLGRYGDEIDAQGDLKAAAELQRILAPGGHLLMVLPMNQNPAVVFNAHRLYSYDMVLDMFSGLELKEFGVIKHIGNKYIDPATPSDIIRGNFDVDDAGCFVFEKSAVTEKL
jgi:SAM-dependent methyltransferase